MNHAITESLNHSVSSSLWGDAWRQLRRDRIAVASFWIIIVYLAMALYGEGVFWYFHWQDLAPPYQQTNLREEYLAPSIFRHPFAVAGPQLVVGNERHHVAAFPNPEAEKVEKRGISLASAGNLTQSDVNFVCDSLLEIIK